MTSDSILGVAMDFYAIHGLKASIEFEEPDTADTSVYLYCRSVDHKADSTYIGTLVVNGEERQSDKVERRAIGRIDDQLYFIVTRHKETLWDFADALREYGFIDAIYITGGADYVFCRDKEGIKHDIGDAIGYPQTKWKGIVPWLVFRRI